MIPVAIVGAGIAGLACARALTDAGLAPVIFDKGRGIGGRVATRRTEGLQFDHGAQFVTAHGAGFAALLRDLTGQGVFGLWADGTGRMQGVGVPGMSAMARAMGAGLDIRQQAQVTAITRAPGGWAVQVGDQTHLAARVVVTVPAPQVPGLLGAAHPLLAPLAAVEIAPCLTLMAATTAPAPFVSRSAPEADLAWIAQDSSKPGRPAADTVAWVAQAGPAFSTRHLEADPPSLTALMLPLLCTALGIAPDSVTHAATHRWRYARVTQPLGAPFLRDDSATLYLGGDWCIGPRVEAAWTSGTTLAADLLTTLP